MRSIEHTPSVNPPFQKIEDAVRTTGLSSFFLRKGCRDGSIPCVRSGRTIYVNVLAFLQQHGAEAALADMAGQEHMEGWA
mgnify:CR=1 FL=1|jgi:hypothetical protein